jgi:hypothetical protein
MNREHCQRELDRVLAQRQSSKPGTSDYGRWDALAQFWSWRVASYTLIPRVRGDGLNRLERILLHSWFWPITLSLLALAAGLIYHALSE